MKWNNNPTLMRYWVISRPAMSKRLVRWGKENPSYTGQICVTPSPESTTTPVNRPAVNEFKQTKMALNHYHHQPSKIHCIVCCIWCSAPKSHSVSMRQWGIDWRIVEHLLSYAFSFGWLCLKSPLVKSTNVIGFIFENFLSLWLLCYKMPLRTS